MKIVKKKIESDNKKMEIEIEGEKHTFLMLLRDVLEKDPDILYASYRLEHPVLSNPTFRVSLRKEAKGNVLDHVIQGATTIKSLCDELAQQLEGQGVRDPST